MSRIHVDGPKGAEEVHLLQAEDHEVTPEVRAARKADRGWMKWPAVIILVAAAIAITGMVLEKTLVAGLTTIGIMVLILVAAGTRSRD
jgi:hypothetical protein